MEKIRKAIGMRSLPAPTELEIGRIVIPLVFEVGGVDDRRLLFVSPFDQRNGDVQKNGFQQGCRGIIGTGDPSHKDILILREFVDLSHFFSISAGFWRKNQGIWGKKMSSSDVYKLLPYLEFGKMSGTLRWAAGERFVLHGKQVSSIFFVG